MGQATLFDQKEAIKRRDKGIGFAIDKANEDHNNWGELAFKVLRIFTEFNKEFMTEDVRKYSAKMGLEQPKNARAWGAVIVRAKKEGLVKSIGYRSTTNIKAHRTPASVWKVI